MNLEINFTIKIDSISNKNVTSSVAFSHKVLFKLLLFSFVTIKITVLYGFITHILYGKLNPEIIYKTEPGNCKYCTWKSSTIASTSTYLNLHLPRKICESTVLVLIYLLENFYEHLHLIFRYDFNFRRQKKEKIIYSWFLIRYAMRQYLQPFDNCWYWIIFQISFFNFQFFIFQPCTPF